MRSNAFRLAVLAATCHGLYANEALDLLEGKIGYDDVTVTDFSEEKSDDELQTQALLDQLDLQDYSARWKAKLPSRGVVYENEQNPVVQRVAFDGLAQWGLQVGELDRSEGDSTDINDSQLQRARIGGLVRAFYNTDLEGRVVADGDGFQGIDTLKATVKVSDHGTVEVGKFRPPFSQEYRQDPSVRIAPGLSPIVEQVAPANSLGIRGSYTKGPWEFGLGWFSGSLRSNLPELNRSSYALVNLAYTWDGKAAVEKGGAEVVPGPGHQRWHLDYLYNPASDEVTAIPNRYRHLLSTGVEVSSGPLDFFGDFLLANGDLSTAWGVTTTARYWVREDALRLVARYNYADTDDVDGLQIGVGVPGAIGDATQPLLGHDSILPADQFHSFYLGLDWHLSEDYLLLSSGIELQLFNSDSLGDASGLLWHLGGRAAF